MSKGLSIDAVARGRGYDFCAARTKKGWPCRNPPAPGPRRNAAIDFCEFHWALLDEGYKLHFALGGHGWYEPETRSIQFRFGPPPEA